MSKVSPQSLTRRPVLPVLIDGKPPVFTSADGKLVFELPGLRKLTAAEFLIVQEFKRQKVQEYITGTGEPGKDGYIAPKLLDPIDGQPVYISETTCELAATLFRAQSCPDDERYTFEELCGFMVDDNLLDQFSQVYALIPYDSEEANKDPKTG